MIIRVLGKILKDAFSFKGHWKVLLISTAKILIRVAQILNIVSPGDSLD